ncbi:MAG TPA: trypsin-like peptidase domain-containing protein [Pseudobacteroides sp.]|uniref:trypsin-like peptidase domain-containing protein n=1 Tax=Pseudobacteroides sp. TaxID=1968840 RepID=UPI002F9501EF
MRIKVFIITVIAVMLLLTSFSSFGSTAGPKLVVNGTQLSTDAKLIGGRVYAPVRAISQSLGADAAWDSSKNTVTVTSLKNDDIVPEVLKSVSPSVVGVIGSLKDSDYSSKFKDSIAHGTGVIIKSDGEILTNAHVVKDMERIVAVLADGSGYEAELKYIDEDSDLALIKINKTGLKAARFGKPEDIITGKTVMAIGTPVSLSLRNSASIGIISGINRGIESDYRLIQTDAAINPGNSGGPLVNLKGEVMGINSSKFSGTGIEGLGFSIPVGTVNYVLSHFYKYGKVKRPDLGVVFEEDWAAKIGLPSNSGLTISTVNDDSGSKKAGLQDGDVLLSVNSVRVNSNVDYNEEMKKYLPDNTVILKIKRKDAILNINVVLSEK